MKPCTLCGQPLPDGAEFCPICREPVEGELAAPSVADDTLVERLLSGEDTPPSSADAKTPEPVDSPLPAGPPVSGAYHSAAFGTGTPPSSSFDPAAPRPFIRSRRKSATRRFVEEAPGFIVMALIFVGALVLGSTQEYFFNGANLQNVFRTFCVLTPYAVAVTVTARCCGPDLSIAAIALYASLLLASGSPFGVALIAGFACGLVNGVLIRLFRLPAIIVTLVTGQLLMGAVFVASDMEALSLSGGRKVSLLIYLLVFVFTLAAGVIYIYFTPAGTPFHRRKKTGPPPLTFLLAYPLAGILAAFGGILGMLRLSSFVPSTDSILSTIDILFIWAAIASSRRLDNRLAPAFYAALAALALALLSSAMGACGMSVAAQGYLKAGLTLVLLFCVGLARWPFGKDRPTLYTPTE